MGTDRQQNSGNLGLSLYSASFFKKIFILCIWLPWILVAAHKIFLVARGLQLWSAGSVAPWQVGF